MKRLSGIFIMLIMLFCIILLSGCTSNTDIVDSGPKVISPLPETLDINNLNDCTVNISLEKGNVFLDDDGKMQMKVKVYSYELYDMVDISQLKEEDIIIRRNEETKISNINRLDTGLIHINGGEENGGFSLISNDNTVYYETGMNDKKAFYELGEVTIPVSDDFLYKDESDLDAQPKEYHKEVFLTEDAGIRYHFVPSNTTIVIKDGNVIEMVKRYIP